MKKSEGKGIENELMAIHQIIVDAEDCISLMQNAFIYNNSNLLQECRKKLKAMKKESLQLIKETSEKLVDRPEWKPYASIPDHSGKIVDRIEKLTGHVNRKIDENTLFSDKAVRETTFLLQRLIEILAPTADIILARNAFLSMYIQESQEGVGKMAQEYATLHEERLIKGVCNNTASSMYIGMLDAIKSIAWHAREIALKLAGK